MKRKKHKRADKQQKSKQPSTNQTRPPKNAKDYFARPVRFQEQWQLTTSVISKMRADGRSLKRVSDEFGIDPRTVIRLAESAFKKRKNGTYAVRARDSLLRVLAVPRQGGLVEVAFRDSREASLLGQYWDAVQKYLQTGDTSGLKKLKRKQVVTADRKRIRLVTDPEQLSRLGNAGVLSFESLYAKGAR